MEKQTQHSSLQHVYWVLKVQSQESLQLFPNVTERTGFLSLFRNFDRLQCSAKKWELKKTRLQTLEKHSIFANRASYNVNLHSVAQL